ncbi:MAG: 1-acyl-sn-glycerol-3-phosphate acyltransferase [Candidatus Woesearchaeota archaeon]|jgi:1-acyl-sn-glycerol-3-phosphate acyltransferase
MVTPKEVLDATNATHRKLLDTFGDHIPIVTSPTDLPVNPDQRRLYVASHISHFDSVALLYSIITQGHRAPRVVCGENLFHPIVSGMMEKWIGIHPKKYGAIMIPRDPRKVKQVFQDIRSSFEQGHDVLIFPEVHTVGSHKKTGRSYSGLVGEVASLATGAIIAANVTNKAIVPVHASYSWVPESVKYPRFQSRDKSTLCGWVAHSVDELATFVTLYDNITSVQVDIGAPILVNGADNTKRKSLTLTAQTTLRSLVPFHPVNSLCYLLQSGSHSWEQLREQHGEFLTQKVFAAGHTYIGDEGNGFDYGKILLSKNGIITTDSNNITVLNPAVVQYYANQVAHHFD